jgi:pectinesterase
VNTDTCLEGLQGLEGTFAKVDVSSGLDHVMSLVKKNLFEVVLSNDQFATATDEDRFPSWINDKDKFLEANETTADAIVAADGSGNYTRVMDAVLAAPKFSMKRYVIYVKKGVYVENVEIDRKKWNIMMIGEGMDATIISGSRNHVDGWTTFRSATFGRIAFTVSHLFSLFLFFRNFWKK